MTDEQVLMMVDAFGHIVFLDAFLGCFLALASFKVFNFLVEKLSP
tara:strand:- start:150 stop:284 length:135 start_codon:yes stop_codon:yes gene_type:complete